MFKEQPSKDTREVRAPKIIGSVFKEMIYSAGVVLGGAIVSVILTSVEKKPFRQH